MHDANPHVYRTPIQFLISCNAENQLSFENQRVTDFAFKLTFVVWLTTVLQQSCAFSDHFHHQSQPSLFAFGSDYGSDSMTEKGK